MSFGQSQALFYPLKIYAPIKVSLKRIAGPVCKYGNSIMKFLGIYTEIDSDEDIDEIDLKVYFRCDFNLYANLACCANCIRTHHPGHLISTIEELNPVIDVFKQSASRIATRFLVADIEKYGGNCKIRTLRMGRICEKLTHFVSNYFRSPDGVLKVPDVHLSRRSKLNKFFDPMPWENLDGVTRENVDQMISYLEKEIKLLNCQEDCNCTEIWDEMHSLGFVNQVERKFAEVIESLGNKVVKKCPFPEEEFQNMRDKARQIIPADYEPVIDQKVLGLVEFYKENCLELLESWREAEMSILWFCLKCASYTEQLEVCVFYDRKWKRGCEHLKSRVSYCSLRTGDEHCGFNAKALMDIPRHDSVLRLATMNLVFKILSAEVEEKIKCQRRKIQISKAIGLLKTKIRRYLLNLDPILSDIQSSIENLKIEWNECLANCSCIDVWNTENCSSRKKLREFLKYNPHKCPTIGMMDEEDQEDIGMSLLYF
ncbi:hypothetical protein CRE_21775 [Caenorhabditis remanei]|uniref:Uncharacterized protein n=1 Tax=Caenorhabditis remanei TaxID=31234 RepID=E3MES0_CAERE|nr:hypothetical protein CRE_21775 [Caenorhabditis remanei]